MSVPKRRVFGRVVKLDNSAVFSHIYQCTQINGSLMHLKLLLILALSALSQSVTAQTNTPAIEMDQIFFQRCLTPLLNEQPVLSEGLDLLPEETALSVSPDSDGRVWMSRDAHISLSAITNPTGLLDGCRVYWHAMAAKGRKIDRDYVVANFDRWADARIQNGDFVEIRRCGDPATKYSRTLESRIERSIPVRVVISRIEDLDFAMLLAAESPTSEPAIPC
jgi:hypothetical protein